MCSKVFCGLFLALLTMCWCHAPMAHGAITDSYLVPGDHAEAETDTSVLIKNIIIEIVQGGELSTNIYPGYTMSFEVAVISAHTSEQNPPIFVYSIFDQNDNLVHKVAEEKKVTQGNVFTKKITLPRNIKPGIYKLNIEAIVGEEIIIQQQSFEVEESPVLALKNTTRSLLTSPLEQTRGWFMAMIVIALIALMVGTVMLYKKHHVEPHSD